jgi:hypothetical protein
MSKCWCMACLRVGGSMRIIVLILTNRREIEFAVDFHSRWPFIVFERL